jgi:hypothetical protein
VVVKNLLSSLPREQNARSISFRGSNEWICSFWLQVGTTQEEQIGTAESVLTEDGVDAPTSHSMVLRKLLVSDMWIYCVCSTKVSLLLNCMH